MRARLGVVLATGGYDWKPSFVSAFDALPSAGTMAPPTGSWWITDVSPSNGAVASAITIDANGNSVIAFLTTPDNDVSLDVASYGPAGWTVTTVDSSLGYQPQGPLFAATDASGGIHIIYNEATNANVRYAYRAPGATTFSVEFVAATGVVYASDATLDSNGRPVVLIVDSTQQIIEVMQRSRIGTGGTWSVTRQAAYSLSPDVRMALDANDQPLLLNAQSADQNGEGVGKGIEFGVPTGTTWTFEPLPTAIYAPQDWIFAVGLVRDPMTGDVFALFDDDSTALFFERTADGTWSALSGPGRSPHALVRSADGNIRTLGVDEFARLRLFVYQSTDVQPLWSDEIDLGVGTEPYINALTVDSHGVPHVASASDLDQGVWESIPEQ